ncbi:hypothetical protein QBC32DRAFT_263128 [Pseudoneurospora amorphoporcata]|uniref:Uncharacterized protein n=1 Tax=Pseudoneurospora amorphoporcata TaxID=241081 RepID=A0AAN6SFD6_9PEZI|nr:hypothetical protein QBC32DRAFT_263128 [Pseudoneurospora amorphoporcata]
MLLTPTLALLPAASPIPPAPAPSTATATATATATLPGNRHDAALKPRQTDFWPAYFWPENFPPDRWPGQDFGAGWGAVSRPCHADQFYSCAGPYMRGDDSCQNGNAVYSGRMTGDWGCFCDHAKKFFKCMSDAENDDPKCWNDGYSGENWQLNWYHNWCGDNPPPSIMAEMTQPRTANLSFTTPEFVYAISGDHHPSVTRVNDPIYKGSGSLLSGECTSTDFTLVSASGGYTKYYAGFQGCNDDRPQCCPWPVSANSARDASPVTVNVEIEPEIEIKHKRGDDYPQPAHGYKAKLKHCPDDYYSVSGGCCPAGYYFFTSAIGGQTPCWSPLGSTASVPPLTRVAAASNSNDGVLPTNVENETVPTSAVNNMVFSRHYSVDSPKSLSLGASLGIALGASVTVSAVFSTIIWLLLRKRRQKKARLRTATQQADNNNHPGIWGGPHGSDEQLFQVPPQELNTFKTTTTTTTTTVDRMAAARTRNSPYASQQAQDFQQPQQSFGFHNVGTHGHNSGMNNDPVSGVPLSVHIPPRVSSRSAAAAGYASPPPIASPRTMLSPSTRDGNLWGGAVDLKGVDSKDGHGPVDSKGGKEEEALQNAGGESGAAGSSSSHNGDRQQRQLHPAELAGHPVLGHNGRESGYGLDEVEGQHEPPPEYRE